MIPRILGLGIIAAVIAVISFATSSLANPPKPPKPTSQHNPHPTSEYDTVHIKEPPDIGIVPMYTGKGAQFVNGLTYPNLKNTVCYTLRFNAKEPMNVVQEWYLSSLPGFGWVINPKQVTSSQVIARHKKVTATIAVYLERSAAPGFKTDILVRYRESRSR